MHWEISVRNCLQYFVFEITISILHIGLYGECCAESCHIWQVIYCVTRNTDLGLWCSS